MNNVRAIFHGAAYAFLLSGCVSAQQAATPIAYTWEGRVGAAVAHFGSQEKAEAALRRATAQCEYELRQMAIRNGFYPGPIVFDECLAAKGWFRMR